MNKKDPGCTCILREHTKIFDCVLCPVCTTPFRKIRGNLSLPGGGGEGSERAISLSICERIGAQTAILFFISRLQPGGHRDTTPAQSIPGSRAQSKLPQYLVTSGCTRFCPTDSSSRCRGPPRRCCPPPAPSSSSPPCRACSSAGPNSSSCSPRPPSPDSPRSPWPPGLVVVAAARGDRWVFREAPSLPG